MAEPPGELGMWRIVDISENGRFLSLSHNSLVVSSDGVELGKISLTDIQSVIVHSHSASITLALSVALAEHGIPLVSCNSNHFPIAITLPVSNNFESAARISSQAEVSKATLKRLWRDIVKTKVLSQVEMLESINHSDAANMRKLISTIKPGDPSNVEARAARYYWQRLLGNDFRRNRELDGLNAHLNYGYTVIRAAMARSVVATGLAPGLGIFHRNRLNAFQLIDDLMEPFRALIDQCVWSNRSVWTDKLTPDAKRELASIITEGLPTQSGVTSIPRVMSSLTISLSEVFSKQRKNLEWPQAWSTVAQQELELVE